MRDAQAAEDAAQETFLSAHRSLLGGTRPLDPPAWLATIARNECRRVWRTSRPLPPLDEARTGTLLDPADIVADRAELSEVADAIGQLPPRQREALVLREFCGLSDEQVAAVMSVTERVVDSLLSRARRGLTERVGYNRFCRAALRGESLTVFGDGRQTRDFTFVADVVAATRAAALAAAAPGRVYNVGGGSRASVREVLGHIASLSGRPLEVQYEGAESGDVRHTGADTTRARRELGFRPTTSVEAGLCAEFEWMQEQELRPVRAAVG